MYDQHKKKECDEIGKRKRKKTKTKRKKREGRKGEKKEAMLTLSYEKGDFSVCD